MKKNLNLFSMFLRHRTVPESAYLIYNENLYWLLKCFLSLLPNPDFPKIVLKFGAHTDKTEAVTTEKLVLLKNKKYSMLGKSTGFLIEIIEVKMQKPLKAFTIASLEVALIH